MYFSLSAKSRHHQKTRLCSSSDEYSATLVDAGANNNGLMDHIRWWCGEREDGNRDQKPSVLLWSTPSPKKKTFFLLSILTTILDISPSHTHTHTHTHTKHSLPSTPSLFLFFKSLSYFSESLFRNASCFAFVKRLDKL